MAIDPLKLLLLIYIIPSGPFHKSFLKIWASDLVGAHQFSESVVGCQIEVCHQGIQGWNPQKSGSKQ